MGHIIDLPRSRLAVDVNNRFEPEYITVRGRAPILNKLKKLAGATARVLLAADPDREGEAITWHLQRALSPSNSDIKRIEFNEITPSAVRAAVEQPREIDLCMVRAQQARRILDRLVGYSVSPILWKKIKRGLSAGRVQSVALRLVCEREKEINDFVPEEYWSIDAKLSATKKTIIAALAAVDGEKVQLTSKEQVDALLAELEGQLYHVSQVQMRERHRSPAAPYTTSRMQQDAANKLGFTSQRTMMVAQQLYEGVDLGDSTTGLITYMRTDSVRVSPLAIEQLRELIGSKYGSDYLSPEVRQYLTAKSAQDAHEAIRPTDPACTPESIASHLSREQLKLYTLIWQRFVASQMSDERANHTSIDITTSPPESVSESALHNAPPRSARFRLTGRIVIFPGFTAVFPEDDKKRKDAILPALEEGEELKLKELLSEQHFTQPPPRFTDASMVKILEESGVGRPSTYSPTISTLLKRFYVTRAQKSLKPTELGMLVNRSVCDFFPDLVDTAFTAQMESDLDRVASDELDWVDMLAHFYDPFILTVNGAMEKMEEMRGILDEPTDIICEKCGKTMVKRIGRHGYFLACPGFPDCRNARAIPLGPCPECEGGHVIQRSTRKGRPFFGCDSYPDCEFSTWDKPVADELCPKCGKLLLEKNSRERGRYIGCSSCDYESVEQGA